jgi:tetratricopeptide (TPR) repeat protein
LIDLKQELLNFHAINLEEIDRDQSNLPDDIRNSIILYNKALGSLRTGSEDIAVIELKKAVTMNPQFYEALNLLGLCYAYKDDSVKSTEIFNRIIKVENNGIIAQKYLNMMNTGDSSADVKDKSRKNPAEPIKRERSNHKASVDNSLFHRLSDTDKNEKTRYMNIVRMIAAFVAGALLIFIIGLIIPDTSKTVDVSSNSDSTVNSKGSTVVADKDYKALYNDLNGKYSLLQKDMDTANKQLDYYKSAIKLYDIESLSAKKQYENAADMLLLLKTTEFTEADKTRFDNLYNSVLPQAAWAAYGEGYSLYNRKSYQEALKKLSKVELYDPKFQRMDAMLYYMGRCNQQLNDPKNAMALYQRLISTYPNSSYARNANIRLQSLTKTP